MWGPRSSSARCRCCCCCCGGGGGGWGRAKQKREGGGGGERVDKVSNVFFFTSLFLFFSLPFSSFPSPSLLFLPFPFPSPPLIPHLHENQRAVHVRRQHQPPPDGKPHGRLHRRAQAPAPEAGLGALRRRRVAARALAKDKQGRVDRQYCAPKPLCPEPPVRERAAGAPGGPSVGLVVEVDGKDVPELARAGFASPAFVSLAERFKAGDHSFLCPAGLVVVPQLLFLFCLFVLFQSLPKLQREFFSFFFCLFFSVDENERER